MTLQDDLRAVREQFEEMRQHPAGDVPDVSYSKALMRATKRLVDKTKPWRVRRHR